MTIIKQLQEVGTTYQKTLEEITANFPTGTCYLSAYCITEYLKQIGLNAKIIIGELALINIKDKYITYGSSFKIKKSINVGDYHAWCELSSENGSYIIDPSMKYNIAFLKLNHNFKVNKKTPSVLVTTEKFNYYWKYKENDKLVSHYNSFISKVPESFKSDIVNKLVEKHPRLML